MLDRGSRSAFQTSLCSRSLNPSTRQPKAESGISYNPSPISEALVAKTFRLSISADRLVDPGIEQDSGLVKRPAAAERSVAGYLSTGWTSPISQPFSKPGRV